MPALVTEAQRKLGECTSTLTAGVSIPELTVESCEWRWPKCTPLDREYLDLFMGCLRELPVCTLDTLRTFQLRGGWCSTHLMHVTDRCIEALTAVP